MVGEMLLLLAGAVSVFMFGMALEDTLSKRKERKPSLVVVALSNGGTVHEAEAMLRDTAANVQDEYKPRDPDYYVQGWIFKGRGYVMTARIAIAKAPVRFRAAADLCRELEEQFNEHIEKAKGMQSERHRDLSNRHIDLPDRDVVRVSNCRCCTLSSFAAAV